jgi:hypothetical protein
MSYFDATAQSSTAIGLSWNFQSDVNGIIQSVMITQTVERRSKTRSRF